MKIYILTLFPEMFAGFLNNSIIKRALAKDIVQVEIINIRDFTKDKHHRVDSAPVGGGAGLIMKCQPIVDALRSIHYEDKHVILLSPRGNQFSQQKARELSKFDKDLVFLCGHYEGIDERVNEYVNELISIGDYILTGGEIPTMAIADSIIRLIDGAITNESTQEESFENGLLEYPQYTEPYEFEGKTIPDILYSGNHQAIEKWRKKQSIIITKNKRPDLFNKYSFSKQENKLLKEIQEVNSTPKWETTAIEKGKKFMKKEVK